MADLLDKADERGEELIEKASTSGDNGPNKDSHSSGEPKEASGDKGDDKTGGSGVAAAAGTAAAVAGRFSKVGAVVGRVTGNKKKLGIAGGIVGLVLIIAFGTFGILSQKIDAMMKNIIHKRFERVEQTIDKRMEKIVLGGIERQVIPRLAASDSPLIQKLYSNIPISKIEDQLSQRGVKFNINANGSGSLTIPDESGVAATRSFSNLNQLDQFFSGSDPTMTPALSAMDDVAEEETNYLEVYQRRFLRTLLRDEFDVKSWKVFDDKSGDDATTELDQASEHATVDPIEDRMASDVACLTGDASSCPQDQREDPDGNSTVPNAKPFDESPENSETTYPSTPANNDSLDTGLKELDPAAAASDLSGKVEAQVVDEVADGPDPINVMNNLYSIDKALENNTIGDVIKARREAQYAGQFSEWATIADSIKDGGKVSGDEVNAAMQKLDEQTVTNADGSKTTTPGIEGSAAFSDIFEGDGTKGIPMDPTKTIDGGPGGIATNASSWYKQNLGTFIDPVMNVWRDTVGAVLNILNKFISVFFSHIPGISNLTDFVSKEAAKLIDWVLGTVATGDETGAILMNNVDAGADVSANAFARDTMGAPALSNQAALLMDQEIAGRQTAHDSQLPLSQQLLATNNPDSMVNRLAIVIPGSVSGGVSQAGDYLASIASNPFKFFGSLLSQSFLPRVFAAAPSTDPYGVQQFGFSDAQNNMALQLPTTDLPNQPAGTDMSAEEWDCNQFNSNGDNTQVDTNVNDSNMCDTDVMVMQSMASTSTSDDDGGLGDGTSSGQ